MTAKAYIGVTGSVTVLETVDICKAFSEAGYSLNTPHIPMLGFLVSYKTLTGELMKNRRYPAVNSLPKLLEATAGSVLTMVHYNSNEGSSLAEQVARIFADKVNIYENGLCRALQLNIVWPGPTQTAKIKEQFLNMQIVLQASNKAMSGKNHRQIAEKIQQYADTIDYVLIDPSGGKGLEFNIDSSVAVYSQLREQCPDLCIGFAGGLTSENVSSRITELISRVGENSFCIDAEGGLRDKITAHYGDDLLNIRKVQSYLQSASLVLK